jgi:hypothetical protein
VADVARRFLVGAISQEILNQQVGRDVERVVAVRRRPVFMSPDILDTILTYQTTNATVPDPQPQFLQLFGHPGATITFQTQVVLLTNLGQKHHIITLAPLMNVYMHCLAMDGSRDVSAMRETHAM